MPRNPVPNTRTYMNTQPAVEAEKPKRTLPSFPKVVLPVLPVHGKKQLPWILVAILVLLASFLFVEYRHAQQQLHPTDTANTKDSQRLGHLILLPVNETPQIQIVSNANKLHSQPFFSNAQNGDKLFVYTQSHRAILYRPSTNIIINVQPIATPTQ